MPETRRRPKTLTGRLLLIHAAALIGILLVLGLVLDRVLERYFVGQLTDSLVSEARAVQHSIGTDAQLEHQVIQLGRDIGARITVIRTDGVVLADSERDPATMANHRTRPEVQAALQGRIGVASRVSATVGTAFRYVALPPVNDRIVRVALPLTAVQARVRTVRVILAVGFGLAAVIGLFVLGVMAGRLLRPLRDITTAVGEASDHHAPPIPERGTDELVTLASTVNRMRDELERRILALQDEQRTRDAILSSLEEGVVLVDPNGDVLYRNDRAAEFTRSSGGPERVPHAVRSLVSQSRGNQSPAVSEFSLASGRAVEAVAVPIAKTNNALVVLRDVTEARRADSIRREFVANASHELKTPVASIRALAETIGETAKTDLAASARFVRQLEREAVRLSRIVSDLLDLSRLESEGGERTEVNVAGLVAEEVERRGDRAKEAGVSLDFSANGDDPVVMGSVPDLGLLVRNLLDNAIQYTADGGAVEVSVDRQNGQAVVAVRDTGIGIPSRDQARIFERFYRVDRARSRETGGTGLGLSIVKHVAENHGGSVTVESELGRGSTFTVRLPISRPS
jgi:two-component system, OmpR family, phosphate regulon sensor histidine kinase PhoR